MNRLTKHPVFKYLALGTMLVSLVVLLTVLFSLLGAISSAVVFGMIMGATRQFKAQTVLTSLVFPGVTLVLTQVSHALPGRQNILLSAMCFGIYWGAYLLTFCLLLLERKNPQSTRRSALGHAVPSEVREPRSLASPDAVTNVAALVEALGEPAFDELRGKWSCRTAGEDGLPRTKVMEIDRCGFTLTISDSEGQVRSRTRGGLMPERFGPLKTLKILNCVVVSEAGLAAPLTFAQTWVYRVAGRTLTIASDFEELAFAPQPILETYLKLQDQSGVEAGNPQCP